MISCQGITSGAGGVQVDNTQTSSTNPTPQPQSSGVLMWKGDRSGSGLYGNETTLTPANVNPSQFGKKAMFRVDGMILAQPLYVSKLDMGTQGTHDVVIVATEHDSVYAFDANDTTGTPLWEKHYAVNGATPAADNFGGRTTIGGEVGITGTPVIDGSTNAMYFVTMLQSNGVTEQWLRAIDVRNGQDFGPGSVKIQASVSGDGRGSKDGTLSFDPAIQNQRTGLVLYNGAVVIAWGSFSDWGVYHGWVMAYDPATLQQRAVFMTTPQHQDKDDAFGPSDHGGGGAIWQAGAIPSVDANGNLYVIAADGSYNANEGGLNRGDSVLKLKLDGNAFQIVDWFTPGDQACVNVADLEIGSGGLTVLPGNYGVTVNKEGRVYLLNLGTLGQYSLTDAQIPQQFMAGANTCYAGVGPDHAEGTDWNRLYGNPSYWNGNIYLAPANATLRQYSFTGSLINTTPVAQSSSSTGMRGGNTVVSAQGNQNAIVWMYEKSANGNAILHAYDATNVSHELWNSTMTPEDGMGVGVSFGTPVVADGRVVTTYNRTLVVYGLK